MGEKGLVHRVCETDYKGSCHGAGVYAGGYLYFCIFTFLYLKFCHEARVHVGMLSMSSIFTHDHDGVEDGTERCIFISYAGI